MRKISLLFFLMTQLFLVLSRSNDAVQDTSAGEEVIDSETYVETYSDTDFEAADWTDDTHSKSADPNFEEVFEDEAVKRLDIVITEERWQSMLDDMTSLYGAFGGSGGPGGGPGGGGLADVDEDPIFVPADVMYNGKEWYRAGVRFKGNSSYSRAGAAVS